jgi:RNA polymerase sigma-70 factor, ECF subfamily
MDTTAMGHDADLSAEASVPSREGALGLLESHFERFYKRVYAYLVHRLFDRELAEELTAEAFCRAASHHRRLYGNERQIEAWLLRTATRLADSHHRRRRLHHLLLGRFAHARPAAVTEDPAAGGDADGASTQVQQVLRGLPPGQQSVIVLRYYMQMSVEEMAVVLNCRPEAARVRLSRAIKEMRRRLGIRTENNT